MAQKPFSERTGVANVAAHGVGALNIDASRPRIVSGEEKARWPANVAHDAGTAASAILGPSRLPFFNGIYHVKATKDDRIGSEHATIKPIGLLEWLIGMVTVPGQTILDPFAGSGTTGIAARRQGRKAILIEQEPSYVAEIKQRLARERFGEII